MLATEDPAMLPIYQDIVLTRLVRLLTMAPTAQLPPGLRQRAIYWAYTDCCTAGLTNKANMALRMTLGLEGERKKLEAGMIGAKVASAMADPNRCSRCGHAGTSHWLPGLGSPAQCNACTSGYQFHAYEGGYLEAAPEAPKAGVTVCSCGHYVSDHGEYGCRILIDEDEHTCPCIDYATLEGAP